MRQKIKYIMYKRLSVLLSYFQKYCVISPAVIFLQAIEVY